MTRDELIKFLMSNYEPDQKLIWHTATLGDVEFYVDKKITPSEWSDYTQDVMRGGDIYGDMAKAIANDFTAYLEEREMNV